MRFFFLHCGEATMQYGRKERFQSDWHFMHSSRNNGKPLELWFAALSPHSVRFTRSKRSFDPHFNESFLCKRKEMHSWRHATSQYWHRSVVSITIVASPQLLKHGMQYDRTRAIVLSSKQPSAHTYYFLFAALRLIRLHSL